MTRVVTALLLISTFACKAMPPSRIERVVAAEVKRHVTVGGGADRNPVPATPATVRDGETAFVANCSMCHGVDGRNTGVPFARTMSPPVPELISPEVQEYSDGQLHSIIVNGVSPSGMPASRGILDDGEIWRIVLYIRHLAKAVNENPMREQVPAAAFAGAHGAK
jgi:mono/diheme cytochrome c family protein